MQKWIITQYSARQILAHFIKVLISYYIQTTMHNEYFQPRAAMLKCPSVYHMLSLTPLPSL